MKRERNTLRTPGRRTALTIAGMTALLIGGFSPRAAPAAGIAPTRVLGWQPGITENLPPSLPLTVYFTRPMDRPSVRRAWRLSPSVAGVFSWNATSVSFTPIRPLHAATTYHLVVGIGAHSLSGVPLDSPFAVRFSTGDALRITNHSPGGRTTQVPSTGQISLTFNHPMVSLTGLSTPPANPPGWRLHISPAVAGHGVWRGTSTWVFVPDRGLQPSSHYTVSLASGARDSWGDPLRRPLHWSFSTLTPEVYSRSPHNGTSFVDPRTTVSVTFNQPMDHNSTARSFTLTSSGQYVPGAVSWNGPTLVFHPAHPLVGGQTYHARIARAARSDNHQATLGHAAFWTFDVAPAPAFTGSEPANGETAYEVRGPFCSGYCAAVTFNTPMSKRSLDEHLSITPSVSHLSTWLNGPGHSGDASYVITGDFKPSASYTVTIAPGVHDAFGRQVSAGYSFAFKTAPHHPSVALYGMPGTNGISYSTGVVTSAPIQLLNVPRLRYTLIRTTLYDLSTACCGPPNGKTVRRWTVDPPHPLDMFQNGGVPLALGDGSPLPPGLYWLDALGSADSPGLPPRENPPEAGEFVAAVDVSLTVKTASNGTLVWATSPQTGEPMAGVRIRLTDSRGVTVVTGATDAHGLHFFPGYGQNGNHYVFAAVASDAGHYGIAELYWSPNNASPSYFPNGSAPYYGQSNPGGYYGQGSPGAYLYTDRPVYRPGQRVDFRALLWRNRDGIYSLLGHRTATVQVNSATGHPLYHATLVLDRFGALRGNFALPKGTATGSDFIYVSLPHGPGVGGSFTVAEYRKPEFLTAVSSSQPSFVQRQTIGATARVRYVFDAPVVHRNVTWTAYAQPLFSAPPGWDAYSFFDWEALWENNAIDNPSGNSQFGQQIGTGAGVTDTHGGLAISLPADLARTSTDETVTIEATALDVNHQPVSGRVVLPVYRAAFAIGLHAAHQVQPAGAAATVQVATVQHDGKPLPGQTLTATVARRTYTNKLVRGQGGQSEWRAVPHDEILHTQTLTTDSAGKATVTFTPADGGEYRVAVSGTDTLGNPVNNALSIEASAEGATDWGTTDSTGLNLKPDLSTYNVGDTAHILVPSPFADATALLTIERGTIRRTEVLHLTANSSVVDVPITLADVPNVYVTVTLYHGFRAGVAPEWRYGVAELHVRIDPRHLIIHLHGNGARHHPGDHVTYTVTTTDAQGRPVSAELSLALVDTAVLALQDESNPDILQALYAERPLEVNTASDGTLSIDHLQVQPDFPLQGEGGITNGAASKGAPPQSAARPAPIARPGGGGGGPAQPTTVRSRFADTAFWRGDLITNAAGRATVSLTLPDNATTWRLDARGVTGTQSVGNGQLQTIASQDLVLRPVLPRFFQVGDSLRIGAVLNNTLARTVRVSVSAQVRGVHLASATPHLITLAPHTDRLLLWPASVPNSKGATVLLVARPLTAGVRPDAVRLTVSVHPPLTDETVATAGQVYGSIRQDVILPRNAVRVPGALTVQLSASLTAGLGAAYGQFRPQMNESNEDTADRVLAAASLRSLPLTVTGLSPSTYRGLWHTLVLGTQRLLDKQYGDGGWPWFDAPTIYESDPLITADVLQALTAGGPHGPQVRQAIQRAQNYLRGAAENTASVSAAERAHILLVLAQTGAPAQGDAESLYNDSIRRSHLDAAPLADLGMALALGHDHIHSATVVAALDGSVRASATGAHWETSGWYPWSTPPVESTAEVLSVLLRLSPHDPLVPAAVRWLMFARVGDGWDGPRDTSQTIATLAAYAHAAREGTADYRYHVLVNGHHALAGHYTPTSRLRVSHLTVPAAALQSGRATPVVVNRVASNGTFGPGPLYYLARLHYYLRATAIAPRNEGVAVSRQYLTLQGKPVTSVAAGTPLKVDLTVRTDGTLLYLNLQDPLPSGCEAIDGSLNTSQEGLFAPHPPWWEFYGQPQDLASYLVHTDLRDNRVSLYAYSLPPGTYHYSYLIEATVPGQYAVSPVHIAETFFPEVFGRGAGQELTIQQ